MGVCKCEREMIMSDKQKKLKKIYQNPIKNEPTWLCVPCQKTFATNYSLRRHMRLIHAVPRTEVEVGANGIMYGHPHT